MAHPARVVRFAAACALIVAPVAVSQERVPSGRVGGPPTVRSQGQRAPGQAIGAGNALDANLRLGSGGLNQGVRRNTFGDAANRLITGNVVAGRQFRDSVGYSAAGEFSESEDDREDGTGLGSNDLFPFISDSALSSVGALSLGSSFARLRFGQELGLIDIQRSGIGASVDELRPWADPTSRDDLVDTFNRVQRDLTADRLTAAQQLSSRFEFSVEGAAVGYTRQNLDDGTVQYGVFRPDSLRGVDAIALQEDVARFGLTTFDAARFMEDVETGRVDQAGPRVYDGRYTGLDLESQRIGDAPDPEAPRPGRVDQAAPSTKRSVDPYADFKDVQAAVALRAEVMNAGVETKGPFDLEGLDAEIEELRAMLAPQLAAREAARAADTRTEAERILDPEGLLPDPNKQPEPRIPESPGTPRAGVDEATIERASTLLKHGREVARLADEADKSRFGDLMVAGERALRDGKYFVAEKQFKKARIHAPRHPFATAGLIHARIGAELYPGAAAELRNLLSERPEMIDVRYDAALAPSGQDLRRAIVDLRERVEAGADPSTLGVLLAYVGRLVREDDAIRTGLTAAEQANPDDPLVVLLRRIWLGEQ